MVIIDVGKFDFVTRLDDNQMIENMKESDIETVIPKVNSLVFVLLGPNKG